MPRKTRKDLVQVDEEQVQEARNQQCENLERELHKEWRAVRFARCASSG